MVMVSFCAFGAAGAFLTMATFEMPYYLAALLVSIQFLMKKDPALARMQSPKRKPWAPTRRQPALAGASARQAWVPQQSRRV